jgi:hypothetical protein
MPTTGTTRRLCILHESNTLPADVYDRFAAQIRERGYGVNAAIARLLRRYLERGFDDGGPEQNPTPATSTPR